MNVHFYLWSLPYFRWEIIFIFIPLSIVFFFFKKILFIYKKTLLRVIAYSILGVVLFDFIDLNFLHIYFFNPTVNLGISIVGVPLEEYIAAIFAPVGIAVLFLAVRRKLLYGKI